MQLKGLGKKKKAGKTWVKPLRLLGDNWVSQSCGAKKKRTKTKTKHTSYWGKHGQLESGIELMTFWFDGYQVHCPSTRDKNQKWVCGWSEELRPNLTDILINNPSFSWPLGSTGSLLQSNQTPTWFDYFSNVGQLGGKTCTSTQLGRGWVKPKPKNHLSFDLWRSRKHTSLYVLNPEVFCFQCEVDFEKPRRRSEPHMSANTDWVTEWLSDWCVFFLLSPCNATSLVLSNLLSVRVEHQVGVREGDFFSFFFFCSVSCDTHSTSTPRWEAEEDG